MLTVANLALLGARNLIVGDDFFNFLKSNLFIGSLPVIVIAFLLDYFSHKLNAFWFWFGTALWILFYPNAPYMISDLIHNGAEPLDEEAKKLIVYDTLIIFSIAMLSVFYGFLSLKIMYKTFKTRYNKRFAVATIAVTLILSSVGFYMGRELISAIKLGNGYLYSWEIFLEPMKILSIVWHALWPIHEHWDAYLMIILFGVVQWMLLVIFNRVGDIEAD